MSIIMVVRKKVNVVKKYATLKTTRGEELLIDKEHYDALKDLRFHDTGTPNKSTGKGWYAMASVRYQGKLKRVYLHQLVMNLKMSQPLGDTTYALRGLEIDHINHDAKNNMSSNLTYLTKKENRSRKKNTSTFIKSMSK